VGFSEVIEANRSVDVEVINGVAEKFGRRIFNIAHMMPGDIEGGDVLRGILAEGIEEWRLALI